MTRDWTEEQARAWLRASLPNTASAGVESRNDSRRSKIACTTDVAGGLVSVKCQVGWTYRSACRALIRAAKRAGIAVNQVQEPGGKS